MEYWKPYDSKQWDFAPQVLYKLNDKASVAIKFEHFEKSESPQLFQKPQWSYTRSGLPEWAAAQADPLVANPVLPAGISADLLNGTNDPNLSGVVVAGVPRRFNQMADSDFRNSRDTSLTATLDVKADDHWSLRASFAYDKNGIDMNFSGRPVSNPNVNAYTTAYNAAIAAGQTPAQAAAAAFPNSGYAQPRRWRWQTTTRLSNSGEVQALGDYKFGGVSLKLLAGAQYNPYSARQRNAQVPDSTSPVYNPSGPLPPWDLRDPSTWNRSVPATLNRSNISLTAFGTPAMNNDITRVLDEAIYGGTTWGFFNDKLLALTALRRTYTSLQTEHDFNTGLVPGTVTRNIDPEFKAAKNTPQVGVLYKLRPDVSAFASYSESFVPAAGTLTVIDKTDPNNWRAVAGASIEPTQGKGYDFGVKVDLFHGRMSGTVAYFDVKNENIVVSVPQTGPNGIFFPTFQSGLQESKGVEADLTVSPTDHWQIYGSASFMDAKTVNVVNAAEDARLLAVNTYAGYRTLNAADQNSWRNVWRFHGKPLQMTAPRSFNLWTKYNLQGVLKGAFVGGGANIIRDQTVFQDTEDRYHQTYTLWNAIVGYATKFGDYPVTFTLNGKNLTNKEYLPSQNSVSRPREFVFSVSTKF
jgi:iron complex outermembrane receptor protein